ncbi:DUF4386 domain-containing protein [Pollutibacter soli]|uniref:DUF4386 domain-containing protein n=1 Tax=Pollutibacter soli TaxID=3034157 RepID=UPI00301354E4
MQSAGETSQLKRTARIAGLLYLVMGITGAIGIMMVPQKLFVPGNTEATVMNITSKEFLFRLGIFCGLVCQTVFIFLALTLFRLFKTVSKSLASTLLALVIVSVPIAYFIIFNQFYALVLLKENFMTNIDAGYRQSMIMASLKMYENGNTIIGIFWGLWLIPFGMLSFRSGFIPKILGVLLVAGGISYLLDATAFILFPPFQKYTSVMVAIFSAIAELAMVLWLLIKGVRYSSEEKLS